RSERRRCCGARCSSTESAGWSRRSSASRSSISAWPPWVWFEEVPMLRDELLAALRTTLVTLIALGVAYPLATTAVAVALFPRQAEGSLVTDDSGTAVGSELIAQPFGKPGYLQPRPSAAGEKGYDAA